MLEEFFRIKREEYEYAKKHNLKTLQEVIRQSVKKTIKNQKLQPVNKQLELF